MFITQSVRSQHCRRHIQLDSGIGLHDHVVYTLVSTAQSDRYQLAELEGFLCRGTRFSTT